MNLIRRSFFILVSLAFIIPTVAQEPEKRISPLALSSVQYKDSYIKIVYSQPSKRKREIFGKLVPYNEVWRTGANEATEITLTRDVKILNKDVPTGTYSVFTIPSNNEWTIIFNKDLGLWGSYNYNSKQDLNRWTVPVTRLTDRNYEVLTIKLEDKNSVCDLNICWDDVCIKLPIQFTEPKK